MRSTISLLVRLAFLAFISDCIADQVPYAIVYGPKAAFNLAAPEGWVIDNSAGAGNGLPCVLYRKSETWETGDPVMYAKIASTSVEEAEVFVKTAIAEMKKERGDIQVKRVGAGKTKDGHDWIVNEYSPNKKYPRTERVAYIQLPKAVAYIVYTSDHAAVFRKHQSALDEVIKSFGYLEPKKE